MYNYKDTIRSLLDLEVEVVQGDDGDTEREEGDDDVVVVCRVCLNGDETEGNVILLCDGEHGLTLGCHQLCSTPPLVKIPDGSWFYPECQSADVGPTSCAGESYYVPTASISTSTSSSNSGSSRPYS